jgi:hypothetical protein
MDCTGRIQNITKDWKTGQLQVTFTINEASAINDIEEIKDIEKLSICAKKYRQKRSLNANAYAWVLISKIAEKVDSSQEEVYEEMLQRYGCFYQDEEGYITITVKAEVDMSKIEGHWKFLKTNGKFTSYLMIKGTSEYDTLEMSKFIDGVVYEAKQMGIETLPPAELQRMVSQWQRD